MTNDWRAKLAAALDDEERELINIATTATDPAVRRAAAGAYDTFQTVVNATRLRDLTDPA